MTIDAQGKHPTDDGFDPDNIVQYGFVHTGQSGPYIALDFAPFMWGMGGDILKENGPKDFTVVLDSPETIAALKMYTELLTEWHASPPASTTYEENQQEEAMRLGKAAMGILPSPSHAAPGRQFGFRRYQGQRQDCVCDHPRGCAESTEDQNRHLGHVHPC